MEESLTNERRRPIFCLGLTGKEVGAKTVAEILRFGTGRQMPEFFL